MKPRQNIVYTRENTEAMLKTLLAKQRELKALKEQFNDEKADHFIKAFEKDIQNMKKIISLMTTAVTWREKANKLLRAQGGTLLTLEIDTQARALAKRVKKAIDQNADDAKEANRLKDQYKAEQIFVTNQFLFDLLIKELSESLPKNKNDDFTIFLDNLFYLNQAIAILVTGGNAEKCSPDISNYLLDLVYQNCDFDFHADVIGIRQYLEKIQELVDAVRSKGIHEFKDNELTHSLPLTMTPEDAEMRLNKMQLICNDRSSAIKSFLEHYLVLDPTLLLVSSVRKKKYINLSHDVMFDEKSKNQFDSDMEKMLKEDLMEQSDMFLVPLDKLDLYLNSLFTFNEVEAFENILKSIATSESVGDLVLSNLLKKYIAKPQEAETCFQAMEQAINIHMQKKGHLLPQMYQALQIIWKIRSTPRATHQSALSTENLTPTAICETPSVSADSKTFGSEGPILETPPTSATTLSSPTFFSPKNTFQKSSHMDQILHSGGSYVQRKRSKSLP